MMRVLQELSLKEQVGITRGNRGLLHVTTAKGKDTCPNNAPNQGGNGMIHDALTEVHNHDNVNNNMIDQVVQYVIESHLAAVQNSNSSSQQDELILSVIKQLKTQVANYTKINLENKSVNDTLTAELERYKEQVKVLNEGQSVDLRSNDNVSDSCFQNPFYLKKAQQLEPKLYVGDIIEKTNPIVIPDSEETLMLAEESRVKPSTSASGSQPSGNTKKYKIQQTPSITQKNKVEAHPRKVKSILKNKDCDVEPKGTARVQYSKLNANSKLKCVKCNGCMLYENHDLYVLDFINNVNARNKSKSVKQSSKRKVWKPTGDLLVGPSL
ncbi:hypothetical protein Tco_0674015 [Tanacetum coccineum]